MRKLLLCLSAGLLSFSLFSQNETKPLSFPFIYATYGFQVPGGDLANRFGVNSDVGAGVGIKTQSNWMFNVEATFIFGNQLNEDPLDSISNENNQIINMYGDYAQVYLTERGFNGKIAIGKIIPVFGCNENSGIYLRGGVGLLQHKIYIDNKGNNAPQITGDYAKGYDRLTNGLSLTEFIGWQNFSKKKAYHFFVGFEFTQGFTQNRRSWDFATNRRMDEKRLDLLYSIKLGWYIPFKSRPSTEYYYY